MHLRLRAGSLPLLASASIARHRTLGPGRCRALACFSSQENGKGKQRPPRRERSLFSDTRQSVRKGIKGISDFRRNLRVSWDLVRNVYVDGKDMNKRERSLLNRTLYDIVLMVPFVIVASVPGGSVLLPLFAKTFPSAMPSTFQMPSKDVLRTTSFRGTPNDNPEDLDREDRLKREAHLRKRMELAFHTSVKQMVDDLRAKQTEETLLSAQLADFLLAVAETGGDLQSISDVDLTKFAHRIDDEVFSHHIRKGDLAALAASFNLRISRPLILRFAREGALRSSVLAHCEKIASLDSMIVEEGGASSLDYDDLVDVCSKRGLLNSGLDDHNADTLELRLDHWLRLTTILKIPVCMVAYANVMSNAEK